MGKGADLGAGRMEPGQRRGSHIWRSPKRVTVVSRLLRLLVTHREEGTLVSGEGAEWEARQAAQLDGRISIRRGQ